MFVETYIVAFVQSNLNQENYQIVYSHSLKINNIGMYILGLWAVANITLGTFGWIKRSGEKKYFCQMSLFWNIINLSIAGFALYSNYRLDFTLLSIEDILSNHFKTTNLYLINAGLDIGYIVIGLILLYLSRKNLKAANLLRGYGKSVILQGGFLLVFDIIMYGVLNPARMDFHDVAEIVSCRHYLLYGYIS